MVQGKEYYAFISYKREDEKWAKWLQDKLEHYKFPTNLNGRTDLPKNIRPTFRDVTDLKPGLLAEEINNALHNSQWLIVVCSPRAAKSPWVCKEAQTFIDLGRANHIIPFVIEGNPFSNDTATECYPEALLNLTGSKELLAANINEMGRDAAAIKVVARMFNLRFDALWQRFEREQRRKRWTWIAGSILIALLGLSIGGYFVRQNGIIESQKERLQQDSITMANHLLHISTQNDSIASQNSLILSQRDSIYFANTRLKDAFNTITSINSDLIQRQTEIVSTFALELLSKGLPTNARKIVCDFLRNNKDNVLYNHKLEFVLRQLFYLKNGNGRRLLDRITIQNYENFVYNAATRVLFNYDSCYYIDYDCVLWEYNTLNHNLNKIFDANGYIDDGDGSIDAYSPMYKKIILTLPQDGELAVVHLPTRKMQKLSNYSFPVVYINYAGTLLLVDPVNSEDKYLYLWDLSNNKIIEKYDNCNNNIINHVSDNIIELIRTTGDTLFFHSLPDTDLTVNYSHNIKEQKRDYELILNDTTNELFVYYGIEDSLRCLSSKDDAWKSFKKMMWNKQTYENYIPEFPNINIPSSILSSEYILSPSQHYAILDGARATLFLYDLVNRKIIKRLSDYKIYALDPKSIFWNNGDNYLGVSFESDKNNKFDVIIIETREGNIIMRFESNYPDLSFSKDGERILIGNNSIPFPRYDYLKSYFAKFE